VSEGQLSLKAKVLIVDDSVVARGLFSRWCSESPVLEVVGTAADGLLAVKAAARHQPDIIILDLDMPVMDGLTAIPELLRVSAHSAILIASSLTARSARLSMQCIALGAVDLQPKPDSNRDLTMSLSFRQELMRKIEGLIGAQPRPARALRPAAPAPGEERRPGPSAASAGASAPAPTQPVRPAQPAPQRLEVQPRALLIGASTGGPRAIGQLLDDMGQAAAHIPVLIAQHMPPVFTASFAEQLAARTGRDSREAQDGETPAPGVIYVAPGGRHMRLDKSEGQVRIRLDDSAPIKFCRPSVDALFTDAALVYGASALAAVLTGMGDDGLDGVRLLRRAGATVVAQDKESSVVWGMPGAVARAGLASQVLPLAEIGNVLAGWLTGGHTNGAWGRA
jgi:two-component system chemotaxis response regulator CheB